MDSKYIWNIQIQTVFQLFFIKLQILEVKIFPKVYLKYTSYLEYRGMFEAIAQFRQEKILIEVYIIYGAMASG